MTFHIADIWAAFGASRSEHVRASHAGNLRRVRAFSCYLVAQVFAVTLDQVEGDKHRLMATVLAPQRMEAGVPSSRVITAFDLAKGAQPHLCYANRRNQGACAKVIDSLAAGYPFSIVHLLEFENRRRILFK